jgi:carboxyl-terminal processing protease
MRGVWEFMKKYSKVIIFVSLVLVLFFVLVVSFAPIFGSKGAVSRIYDKDDDYYYYLEIFNSVYNTIKSSYVDEDKTSAKTLFQGAIKGMLESLGDPHTAFLTEDDFKELTVETSGKFGGLGIHISSKDGYIYIVSPIEGTPAYREGIKPGDYIIYIEDQSTKDMPVDKAVKLLRGMPGTKVKITIRRGDQIFDKVLTREIINIPTVKWGFISEGSKNIAYIKITQFSGTTFDSFVNAFKTIDKSDKQVKGVIIDLRYNPGGLLDEVLRILDVVIPKGLLLETRGRIEGASSKTYASGNKPIIPLDVPMVVIINEGSASASEIMAGVLQDTHRAVVVGKKSFGKGSVQTVRQLPDGSGFRLTIARYYLPSGRTPDKVGITPDIEVKTFDLSEEVQANILKVEKEGYIREYMKGKESLSNEDVDKLDKILRDKGIVLDKRIIRTLALREIPGIPLYDPEDEFIIKAKEILENYDKYRKEFVTYN